MLSTIMGLTSSVSGDAEGSRTLIFLIDNQTHLPLCYSAKFASSHFNISASNAQKQALL